MSRFLITGSDSGGQNLSNGSASLLISDITASSLTVNGNSQMNGNLTCTGTITADTIISNVNLDVIDPLITMGIGAPDNLRNLGILEEFKTGTTKYSGIVRSFHDSNQYLIEGVPSKPLPGTDIRNLNRGGLVCNTIQVDQAASVGSIGLDLKYSIINESNKLKIKNEADATLLTITQDASTTDIKTNNLDLGKASNIGDTTQLNIIQNGGNGEINIGFFAEPENTPNATINITSDTKSTIDLNSNTENNILFKCGLTGTDKSYRIQHNANDDFIKYDYNYDGLTPSTPLTIKPNQVKVKGLSVGSGATDYTLPSARGTNNQILKTNASGVVSWASDEGTGTLQDAFDASGSLVPQILTDLTNTNLTLQQGVGVSSSVFNINNSAGLNKITLKSDGTVSADNIDLEAKWNIDNNAGDNNSYRIRNASNTRLFSIAQNAGITDLRTSTLNLGKASNSGDATILNLIPNGGNAEINMGSYIDPSQTDYSDLTLTSQLGSTFKLNSNLENNIFLSKGTTGTDKPWQIRHRANNNDVRFIYDYDGTPITALQIQPTEIRVKGVKVGTSPLDYTLPSVRGTNNQVLKTDGSGVVSWQTDAGIENFQTVYNNSTGPQITTSAALGALTIQKGTGAGGDVLKINNDIGTTKTVLKSNGDITCSDIIHESKWTVGNDTADTYKIKNAGGADAIEIAQDLSIIKIETDALELGSPSVASLTYLHVKGLSDSELYVGDPAITPNAGIYMYSDISTSIGLQSAGVNNLYFDASAPAIGKSYKISHDANDEKIDFIADYAGVSKTPLSIGVNAVTINPFLVVGSNIGSSQILMKSNGTTGWTTGYDSANGNLIYRNTSATEVLKLFQTESVYAKDLLTDKLTINDPLSAGTAWSIEDAATLQIKNVSGALMQTTALNGALNVYTQPSNIPVSTTDSTGIKIADNLELSTFKTKIRGVVPSLPSSFTFPTKSELSGLVTLTSGNTLASFNSSIKQRMIETSNYFTLNKMDSGSTITMRVSLSSVVNNDLMIGMQFTNGTEAVTGNSVGTSSTQYYLLVTASGEPSELYEQGQKTADALPNISVTSGDYFIILTRTGLFSWDLSYKQGATTLITSTPLLGAFYGGKRANFIVGDKSNVLSSFTMTLQTVSSVGYNTPGVQDISTIQQVGGLEFKETDTLVSINSNISRFSTDVIVPKQFSLALETFNILVRDTLDIIKSTPTAEQLQLGEWDFASVSPTNVSQISPTYARFNNVALARVITGKYYIIPGDISVGGFVEYNMNYTGFGGAPQMMAGVCFKNSGTVLAGFGTGFANSDYFAFCQGGSNLIAAAGLTQGALTPVFTPTTGNIKTRITRNSSVQWTITYFNNTTQLSPSSTFGVELENSFAFQYAGIFNDNARIADYFNTAGASCFTYNLWNPGNYKYSITQNSDNELSINQPNGNQIMSLTGNDVVINKQCAMGAGLAINTNLFSKACPVTCTFYRLVRGTTLTAIATETELTAAIAISNVWGAQFVPRCIPGSSFKVHMTGLISTLADSRLKLRMKLGSIIVGETVSATKLTAGNAARVWKIDAEIIPIFTSFSTSQCFVKVCGMFQYIADIDDKDTLEALSFNTIGAQVGVPLQSTGNLIVTGEWLTGSTAGSSITVDSIQYEYSGYNV